MVCNSPLPVCVSCPGCVPIQLLVQLCLLAGRSAWVEKSLALCKHSSATTKYQCIISAIFINNPKNSNIQASISSIPSETMTESKLTWLPKGNIRECVQRCVKKEGALLLPLAAGFWMFLNQLWNHPLTALEHIGKGVGSPMFKIPLQTGCC